MHKVLLSIGTNYNTESNLKLAMDKLRNSFVDIKFTEIAKSKPYGNNYKNSFLNVLAFFKTDMQQQDIVHSLKSIEASMGRKAEDKSKGIIIIDIDLIKWDNEIIKPQDFQREYVIQLLKYVCNF